MKYLLYKSNRARKSTAGTAALVVAAVALSSGVANAVEYVLPSGTDTITLSGGATTDYSTVAVGGDLTITGDGWIKTPAIFLNGGTITVDGSNASIGSGHASNNTPTTLTVTNSVDGTYGKIIVKNGKNNGSIATDRFNFSAKVFNVATNASDVVGVNGSIDLLSVDNSSVCIRDFYNYSTLTALVSVTGTSQIHKGGGHAAGGGIFHRGPVAISLQNGADLRFEFSNQKGTFNDEGVEVSVIGNGDVAFRHMHNTADKVFPMLRKGAFLNNTGSLTFMAQNTTYPAWFRIADSNAVGPNVTTIASGGTANTTLDIMDEMKVTVRDVSFSRANYADKIVGDGTMVIDASATARTFSASVPPIYEITESGVTSTKDNHLTIAKIGLYEAVINSTNLPALDVRQGTVRITTNCVIGTLKGAAGSVLLADGCTISITGEAQLKGLSLQTANGGSFTLPNASRHALFEPGNIQGTLHVAAGDAVFSKYGLSQKYWRWTFTKISKGVAPLHFSRLLLLGYDGEYAAPADSNSAYAYKQPNEQLEDRSIRWRIDPSATLALDPDAKNYQSETYVRACLRTDLAALNNFAYLSSPEINPNDAATHIGIEFKLGPDDQPVTGYNMVTALANDYPAAWTVEASDDGENWIEVEARSDVVHANPSSPYYTFDGEYAHGGQTTPSPVVNRGKCKELFHFKNYRSDGLAPLLDPLSLQVDGNGTVDLRAFTGGQSIGGITVDLANGNGTIYGGVIADAGTVTITNAASSGYDLTTPLPLTLSGTESLRNLKMWNVVIDGIESRLQAMCVDGSLILRHATGFILVVR